MSEDHHLPQPADAFSAALLLLVVAADAKACQGRLLELRAAERAAEKARVALAAERAAFDAHASKERAAIELREKEARKVEVRVRAAERHLASDLAKVDEFKSKHLLQKVGNGGLIREFPDAETKHAMRGT